METVSHQMVYASVTRDGLVLAVMQVGKEAALVVKIYFNPIATPFFSIFYLIISPLLPYAACVGTWGNQCANKCQCMNGATCDPVTGYCNCTAGWLGTTCDTGDLLLHAHVPHIIHTHSTYTHTHIHTHIAHTHTYTHSTHTYAHT